MSGFEINEDNNNNNQMSNAFKNATAKTETKSEQKTQQTFTNNNDNPFGFSKGVSLYNPTMAYAPIRNAMGSEAYLKLVEQMREMAKRHNRNNVLEVTILELDRNVNPNLHFASVVVAVQSKSSKELGVGYNVVMMEATGEPIQDRQDNFQGEAYSIPVYSEEVDNKIFREEVVGLLNRTYGAGIPLFMSDTAVVPADFNHEDTVAVESMLQNAAAAASNVLVMFAAGGRWYHDLNLSEEVKKREDRGDADLTFVYKFDNMKKLDFLKLPVRSSVTVHAMTGFKKSNHKQLLNSGAGPRTITEATGFVELMPVAPRYAQGMFNPMMPMQQGVPTQRLAPVLVLNSLTSSHGNSPACMMLNVLVAADLNRNHGWVSAFQTKSGGKVGQIDLTDVTAITIDMPSLADPNRPEEKPQVGPGGLPLDQLLRFLGTYCVPNLHVAVDVPVAAHNTWYMSVFMDAAKGDPTAQGAIDKAMDALTGGLFTRTKPAGLKMFATTPMLLERGFWDLDKERRDVADIDYVAVCNYAYANGNPALVEQWTNTFMGTEDNTAQRLHKRRQIIQDITGRSATFVGRAVRVFWHGEYLVHALNCLTQVGITVSTDGRGSFGFHGGRAQADFLNNAGMAAGAGWASNMNGSGGTNSWNAMNSQWTTNGRFTTGI